MSTLPIDSALPALRAALRAAPHAVLQAPPGAGKTTRVPLALLAEPWLGQRKIVMLEPRRLAARAAAGYMARQLGEVVGHTVGYRVRLESKVGPSTRIEVVTEGILTRLLHGDVSLDAYGLVVFDEFHERSLHADLGLALTLQSQALLRPELRILVMSATLDGEAVARLLGNAPIVTSEGRLFPVDTRYQRRPAPRATEQAVAAAVRDALRTADGDVLVFLPGAAEIHRVAALLTGPDLPLPRGVSVIPLFGDLPLDEQDRAIRPSPPSKRKVVLATSIAETSLTIEGVRVVIDSGLARVPRFSARTGMTRLDTVRVSRAAADQRRGRAGRLGPGICVRLWEEAEQAHLVPFAPPEIAEADLAPLALELAVAGVRDPAELKWLDPPPAAAYAQAVELLLELAAVDATGRPTEHGRRMSGLGLHPRLAHMVMRGAEIGHGMLACRVAALLGERDILERAGRDADADLASRLHLLEARDRDRGVDEHVRRRVLLQAEQLGRRLRLAPEAMDPTFAGLLLAFAYPDRIAQRRDGSAALGRFLLRNGTGAVFAEAQPLSREPYVVAAELGERQPESRIFLAAAVTQHEIEEHFAHQIESEQIVDWDPRTERVVARLRERLGAIVISDAPLRQPEPAAVSEAFLRGLRLMGVAALPWTEADRRLQQRMVFVHGIDPTWPDVRDVVLETTLTEWMAPHVHGMRGKADLSRLDASELLLGLISWQQRRAIDDLAPTHFTVPSGSRIPIDYSEPTAPVLAVRLQEVFGLLETPRVGGGRVPVTMHLLSPARRPVQVTKDLAGFWRTTYFDVRKDLRGRYPKHFWPDDPLDAKATSRVQRRS